MMREDTKKRYKAAINTLIDKNIVFKNKELNVVSRKYFKNFVMLHWMKDGGFLIDNGDGTSRVNPNASSVKIINNYHKRSVECQANSLKKKQQSAIPFPVEPKPQQTQPIQQNGHTEKYLTTKEGRAAFYVEQLRMMGYEVICKKVIEL
jgi:hypothetical protein